MKGVILAAFVAVAVTAGIASAGIASLADGATVLINATGAIQTHTTPRLAMDARQRATVARLAQSSLRRSPGRQQVARTAQEALPAPGEAGTNETR
jgi:hypothetical protein